MNHAYAESRDYGELVRVICNRCTYEEQFTYIRDANAAARAHNNAIHTGDDT